MKSISNTSIRDLNTFGIDIKVEKLLVVEQESDIRQLILDRNLEGRKFVVLGGGSNMVFMNDYRGTVVLMANKGICPVSVEGDGVLVEAQAGEVWSDFVRHCVNAGFHGLENLAGIPGTVGASPVQNVGAYGVEAKDVIHLVRAYDVKTGELRTFTNKECEFGYRDSVFKHMLKDRYIVSSVIFRLSRQYEPNLEYRALANALGQRGYLHPTARQVAETVEEVRDSKLPNPKRIGSAGSFFKNPVVTVSEKEALVKKFPQLVCFDVDEDHVKLAAGWLIEQCGWRGRALGPVGVYEKQSLVLVNLGGCTGPDVERLAKTVVSDVEAHFGVHLEPEAIFVR